MIESLTGKIIFKDRCFYVKQDTIWFYWIFVDFDVYLSWWWQLVMPTLNICIFPMKLNGVFRIVKAKKKTRTDIHDFAGNAKSIFFASPVCSVNYHTSSKTIVCFYGKVSSDYESVGRSNCVILLGAIFVVYFCTAIAMACFRPTTIIVFIFAYSVSNCTVDEKVFRGCCDLCRSRFLFYPTAVASKTTFSFF